MFDTIPIGLVIVLIAGILIFLGIGQRVLDRMRLTDSQALILLGIMVLGSFLPEIRVGPAVSFDLGGALIPLGIAVYLIATAGTAFEKWRAVSASLVAAGVVYASDKLILPDPGRSTFPIPLDSTLLPAVIAGFVAYMFGRSRRAAFIAGTMAVLLTDIIIVIENAVKNVPGAFNAIGGAGVFDASIVAGFLAVFLAEVIGETREFLQGGPSRDRPGGLLRGLEGRVRIGGEGGGPWGESGADQRGQDEQGREERRGETENEASRSEDGKGRAELKEQTIRISGMVLAVVLSAGAAVGAGILGPRLHGSDEVLSRPLFTVQDEAGRLIMQTARWVHPGDEYIDGDNRRYSITRVNGRFASAEFMGIEPMPTFIDRPMTGAAFSSMEGLAAPLFGRDRKITVGIYHTHNDESYTSTQGTSTVEGRGGIHKVGDAFADALKKKGLQVVHDQTVHLPHDNGAYRRSRRTAFEMLRKRKADLVFDVHRDAGPWESYAKKVDGNWIAQVRLVVGRPSPNEASVLSYAKELKSMADKMHPGLIKGIFIGRDAYNQDLTPRSMLLEVGTEQNAMQSAQRGVQLFANVVERWAKENVKE